MRLTFSHRGSFDNMYGFLTKMRSHPWRKAIEPHAQRGVDALAANTPVDTGLAANSWEYEIEEGRSSITVVWKNFNVENGFSVVIALQYGYATGTGGYVQGRDFINPTMAPIFDDIANSIWKVVTSA